MKDLFSRQSADYARFRPKYPAKLFEYLASLVKVHDLAWDCGTGNGQAAIGLADWFECVVGTDLSSKQLAGAQQHPKVEYRESPAETTAFADHSVDLVAVAQAFHWFREDEFFAEALRVLKPGGVLAFWCYGLAKITPEVDIVVHRLYEGILGTYWEPERKLVEEGYRKVRLPMQELVPPAFEMMDEWSFDRWVGYLGTWSALQTYIQREHSNPLDLIISDLQSAWGERAIRTVRWELALRVGRAVHI